MLYYATWFFAKFFGAEQDFDKGCIAWIACQVSLVKRHKQ